MSQLLGGRNKGQRSEPEKPRRPRHAEQASDHLVPFEEFLPGPGVQKRGNHSAASLQKSEEAGPPRRNQYHLGSEDQAETALRKNEIEGQIRKITESLQKTETEHQVHL